MLAPLHSVMERKEHEKYLFLPLNGNTEHLLETACAHMMDGSNRRKGKYASFSVLFKQKDSMLNISAVTKSTMKP